MKDLLSNRNEQTLRLLSQQQQRNNRILLASMQRHNYSAIPRHRLKQGGHEIPTQTGKLHEKITVVTGAGGRLGRSVCEMFDREGATVIAIDRNEERMSKLPNVCFILNLFWFIVSFVLSFDPFFLAGFL